MRYSPKLIQLPDLIGKIANIWRLRVEYPSGPVFGILVVPFTVSIEGQFFTSRTLHDLCMPMRLAINGTVGTNVPFGLNGCERFLAEAAAVELIFIEDLTYFIPHSGTSPVSVAPVYD